VEKRTKPHRPGTNTKHSQIAFAVTSIALSLGHLEVATNRVLGSSGSGVIQGPNQSAHWRSAHVNVGRLTHLQNNLDIDTYIDDM